MKFVLSDQDREFCGLVTRLRDSCECLPPVWTDCGCTPEIDPQVTTYSNAGKVSSFVKALEISTALGYNNNASGKRAEDAEILGQAVKLWKTYIPSDPVSIAGPDTVTEATFCGVEITFDRRLADVTEQWFELVICGDEQSDLAFAGGAPLAIPFGQSRVQLTELGVDSFSKGGQLSGVAMRVRFKMAVDGPKRVFVPLLKASASSGFKAISPAGVASESGTASTLAQTGVAGSPTVAIFEPLEYTTNTGSVGTSGFSRRGIWLLCGTADRTEELDVSLKFISQDDSASRRALSSLSDIIALGGKRTST